MRKSYALETHARSAEGMSGENIEGSYSKETSYVQRPLAQPRISTIVFQKTAGMANQLSLPIEGDSIAGHNSCIPWNQ